MIPCVGNGQHSKSLKKIKEKQKMKTDPTQVPSVKIPMGKKAKRNEPGYFAKKNLKRLHPVTERTHKGMVAEEIKGIKGALGNE
jgi:hypothetical protein